MTELSSVIIHQNDHFIVACKPAGISFHSESGEGFFASIQRQLGGELYPVHRLDKMTSGLILFAKSKAAAKALGQRFEHREVEKYYLAIAHGKPKKKQGAIIGDMEPARRGNWRLLNRRDNPAISQFFSHSLGSGLRAYLVKPATGKTHQIRVALKSLGTGIAGDSRYSKDTCEYDRGYLHAYSLSFELFNKPYRFISPPTEGALFNTQTLKALLDEQWQEPGSLSWPAIATLPKP